MTFLLLALVPLSIILAFSLSKITQKDPRTEPKEDTTKDPKSLTLYQDYLKQQGLTGNLTGTIDPVTLSRIRNSYGEATAILVNKHYANNQGTKTSKKSQILRNNRTNNLNTRDEDSRTSFYDLDFALAADYDLNSSRPNHSDVRPDHDHSCHDSGSNHSSYDSGSYDSGCHDSESYDSGGHDCGGGDF
jgi:hypothetical protein